MYALLKRPLQIKIATIVISNFVQEIKKRWITNRGCQEYTVQYEHLFKGTVFRVSSFSVFFKLLLLALIDIQAQKEIWFFIIVQIYACNINSLVSPTRCQPKMFSKLSDGEYTLLRGKSLLYDCRYWQLYSGLVSNYVLFVTVPGSSVNSWDSWFIFNLRKINTCYYTVTIHARLVHKKGTTINDVGEGDTYMYSGQRTS